MRSEKTRTMVEIAMLSAIAVVLMLFEFPLPFIAPPFYELDFSEVPVLIGAFALGPWAGVIIEAIKILLNLVINGTITAFVGEIGNFIIGVAFVLPAALIYKHKKSKKTAMIGLATGGIIMIVASCFINVFILLPGLRQGIWHAGVCVCGYGGSDSFLHQQHGRLCTPVRGTLQSAEGGAGVRDHHAALQAHQSDSERKKIIFIMIAEKYSRSPFCGFVLKNGTNL